jgi:hypothetical protein
MTEAIYPERMITASMTDPGDIGRTFAQLIFQALESPATVDRNDLLTGASAFLDAAQAGDPDGLRLARHVSYKALDWCVFSAPEHYKATYARC